jgi:anti-sigma B factor antagonist
VAPLEFDTTLSAGVAVVALAGELDLSGAGVLEHEIERLSAEPGVETVVLDMRGLEFLDSSGLRLVAMAERRLAADERRLALVRGPETVQRVFDITRMTERLDFVDAPDAVKGDQREPR